MKEKVKENENEVVIDDKTLEQLAKIYESANKTSEALLSIYWYGYMAGKSKI